MIDIKTLPWRDIGHGVEACEFRYAPDGQLHIAYRHDCVNGDKPHRAFSAVPVSDSGSGRDWKLEQRAPLSISPSLLCCTCKHHGFIRRAGRRGARSNPIRAALAVGRAGAHARETMTLFLPESEYRSTARQLIEWACVGPVGVTQASPRYLVVTEGREALGEHHGTSCGELPHWELFRCGVRCPFINRNEAHGWRPVVNIAALAFSPVAKVCTLADRYQPGDIIYIWERADTEDAHTMCVVEHDPDTHVLTVGEYGQPGGKLATHQLHQGTDMAGGKARSAWFCGTRALQRWVPLLDVIHYADAHGELAAPELSCLDVLDAPGHDTDHADLAPEISRQ